MALVTEIVVVHHIMIQEHLRLTPMVVQVVVDPTAKVVVQVVLMVMMVVLEIPQVLLVLVAVAAVPVVSVLKVVQLLEAMVV